MGELSEVKKKIGEAQGDFGEVSEVKNEIAEVLGAFGELFWYVYFPFSIIRCLSLRKCADFLRILFFPKI